MEQNIYDILVNGLDLNAFYSFIDSKTELNHNTPELVFQYTTWSAHHTYIFAHVFFHYISNTSLIYLQYISNISPIHL